MDMDKDLRGPGHGPLGSLTRTLGVMDMDPWGLGPLGLWNLGFMDPLGHGPLVVMDPWWSLTFGVMEMDPWGHGQGP